MSVLSVRNRISRVARVALTAGLVAGASLVIDATPANAYTLHACRYSPLTVIYRSYTSVPSAYSTATDAAMGRWNATSAPVTFSTATAPPVTGISKVSVGVDNSQPTNIWAYVSMCPSSTNRWPSQVAQMRWNTAGDISTRTATQKRIVGTHELGHVLGLGHVADPPAAATCTSAIAVMRQGTAKFNCGWGTEPWADDVNGVNAAY